MKLVSQALKSLKKAKAAIIVTSLTFYAQSALALEHSDDFKSLYDQLLGWAGGTLGKSIALLFLLIGLGTGLARGSIYAAVVAIAAGLSLVIAPTIIDSIFAGA